MTCKRAHDFHPLSIFALFVAALLAPLGFSPTAWAQNPVPLISQPLVPEAAAPGGTGFTLTVNGTGFVSGSVVHTAVAGTAKCNQVLLGVLPRQAAKFLVVDFKVRHRAAGLASPSITP